MRRFHVYLSSPRKLKNLIDNTSLSPLLSVLIGIIFQIIESNGVWFFEGKVEKVFISFFFPCKATFRSTRGKERWTVKKKMKC